MYLFKGTIVPCLGYMYQCIHRAPFARRLGAAARRRTARSIFVSRQNYRFSITRSIRPYRTASVERRGHASAHSKGNSFPSSNPSGSYGVRARVWESMEVTRGSRITDSDLHRYHRLEPGWIADRICSLAIAAGFVRIAVDREPAFESIRQIVESRQAARQLLLAGLGSQNWQWEHQCCG